MAVREFGFAYARASMAVDDDQVSMLSPPEHRKSQYQPYRPAHLRLSSSQQSTRERAALWVVSPIELQHATPPEQPTIGPLPSPLPRMDSSLFGNRAVLGTPYQESVPWANSTNFRSTMQDPPKPTVWQTDTVITEEDISQKSSRRYFRHPRHIPTPWKTGFWLRFPWWGAGALLLILMLTGASAGILLASHGTSMADWKLGADNAQPYVYISVSEMAMNFLILFALANGLVVRFWQTLLHGTTLSSIHDTYESAQLWPALKILARLRFNTVAVASILAALSFIRGPLLQRALTLEGVVYRTSPPLLALGIVLSVIGVAAVIPLYSGFWELGRKATLNPLEIARAFGAPMLEGIDGNATPEMVVFERGGMSVRYGALERYGDGKRLRVEEMTRATVRMPWRGEVLG